MGRHSFSLVMRGRATRYGPNSRRPKVVGMHSFFRGHCRQGGSVLSTTPEPVLSLYEGGEGNVSPSLLHSFRLGVYYAPR
jgi:hypothetical protein